MFSWLKRNKTDNHDIEYIIDMIMYHYKVDGIYNDMIIIDLDVDTCDIEKGQKIKLLNKIYEVSNIEYIQSNLKFKYRLVAVEI